MVDIGAFEQALAGVEQFDASRRRRLRQGRVVQQALRVAKIDGAQAVVHLPFAPDRVWEVITDYATFPDWMPGVRAIPDVTWISDEVAHVHYVVESPLRDVRYVLERTHHAPDRVRWLKLEGDLRGVWGGYDLVAADDGTLLRYWAFVDPGFRVPSAVRSFFTARGIERLMMAVRDEAGRRSGAT